MSKLLTIVTIVNSLLSYNPFDIVYSPSEIRDCNKTNDPVLPKSSVIV